MEAQAAPSDNPQKLGLAARARAMTSSKEGGCAGRDGSGRSWSVRTGSSAPRSGSRTVNFSSGVMQKTRKPDDEERHAPAHQAGDEAAQHDAQGGADGYAERVHAQGARALLGRKVIANQGIGGSHAARLADAHPHARHEELREAVGESAHRGHQAPQRERRGHDSGAADPVGQPRDGNSEQRVEQGEREAAHQSQLRIAQMQLGLDRDGEDADDLPVDEVEGVHDDQDHEHIRAVAQGCRSGRDGGAHAGGAGRIRDRKPSKAAMHSGSSSSGTWPRLATSNCSKPGFSRFMRAKDGGAQDVRAGAANRQRRDTAQRLPQRP